jgi:pimeloyl-ACP methyl ester carboxylesterase
MAAKSYAPLRVCGFLALGAALICACSTPARRADAIAGSLHFEKQIETGKGFRHVVYRNSTAARDGILHIYIEGDGNPYWQPEIIATDPTARNPLMLRLMALDSARSVYLGRPCYLALYQDGACGAVFWTLRRYGPEVLDSMEAVLRAEIAKSGATQVTLFGHSGGGTLAVLLAQRVDAVARVVTIGANLDLPAWCALHHFSPLVGSLNPADQPLRRTDLQTLHLVGENDANTPPSLIEAAARARGGEPVRVVAHFDHRCCWESAWPQVLRENP